MYKTWREIYQINNFDVDGYKEKQEEFILLCASMALLIQLVISPFMIHLKSESPILSGFLIFTEISTYFYLCKKMIKVIRKLNTYETEHQKIWSHLLKNPELYILYFEDIKKPILQFLDWNDVSCFQNQKINYIEDNSEKRKYTAETQNFAL